MRALDVVTNLLPQLTSTTFGVGRHLDGASRRAFRAGIGRDGVRALHFYLRDARHSDAWCERVAGARSAIRRSSRSPCTSWQALHTRRAYDGGAAGETPVLDCA